MCTVGSDGKIVLSAKYLRILKVIDEVYLAILYISVEKQFFCTRVFQNIQNFTVHNPILEQEVLLFLRTLITYQAIKSLRLILNIIEINIAINCNLILRTNVIIEQ
jgi:hypothetical protein